MMPNFFTFFSSGFRSVARWIRSGTAVVLTSARSSGNVFLNVSKGGLQWKKKRDLVTQDYTSGTLLFLGFLVCQFPLWQSVKRSQDIGQLLPWSTGASSEAVAGTEAETRGSPCAWSKRGWRVDNLGAANSARGVMEVCHPKTQSTSEKKHPSKKKERSTQPEHPTQADDTFSRHRPTDTATSIAFLGPRPTGPNESIHFGP
jgi:hypothetical protein